MYTSWVGKILENAFDFLPLAIFKLKQKPKLECVREMPHDPSIMTIFVSKLHDTDWPMQDNFYISPTL